MQAFLKVNYANFDKESGQWTMWSTFVSGFKKLEQEDGKYKNSITSSVHSQKDAYMFDLNDKAERATINELSQIEDFTSLNQEKTDNLICVIGHEIVIPEIKKNSKLKVITAK